jgi:hypothetical protein
MTVADGQCKEQQWPKEKTLHSPTGSATMNSPRLTARTPHNISVTPKDTYKSGQRTFDGREEIFEQTDDHREPCNSKSVYMSIKRSELF